VAISLPQPPRQLTAHKRRQIAEPDLVSHPVIGQGEEVKVSKMPR
jgi:hypothetical protein